MAKRPASYVCQSCGAVSTRWAGRCAACGEWNSISEEVTTQALAAPGTGLIKASKGKSL